MISSIIDRPCERMIKIRIRIHQNQSRSYPTFRHFCLFVRSFNLVDCISHFKNLSTNLVPILKAYLIYFYQSICPLQSSLFSFGFGSSFTFSFRFLLLHELVLWDTKRREARDQWWSKSEQKLLRFTIVDHSYRPLTFVMSPSSSSSSLTSSSSAISSSCS